MIVFVIDICLICYRNNFMRMNEDVFYYIVFVGNCFEYYYDLFIFY